MMRETSSVAYSQKSRRLTKCPVASDRTQPLASHGVRVMYVGNYCVYYQAKNNVVSVGRILYFRRDADAVFASGWNT